MIPDISEQGTALVNRWLVELYKCVESLSEIGLVQVRVSYWRNSIEFRVRTHTHSYGASLTLWEVEAVAREMPQSELWLVHRAARHIRQLRAMWQS